MRSSRALTRLWRGFSGARSFQSSAAALQAQAQPAPDTMEVFVNDEPVTIPKGSTVLQACDAAGIDVPRWVGFCAWARLRAGAGGLLLPGKPSPAGC
jgi:NADH dehydrogenase (ubiquinone) Fe-S protein 1